MIMKKNDKIHIPVSSEMKERLKRQADELGITLSAYCTLILSRARIKVEEM